MPDEPPRSPLDAFRAPDSDEAAQDGSDEATDEADPDEADAESDEIDPAFYANGGISISGAEQEVLGELHGRRVLMVGAGNGEDAASLVNLGAMLTVVDDDESIEAARTLAADAGLDAEFMIDDPSALSVDLRSGDFDVVYSGFGAIDWMDNLSDWAGGVADCLKKGGRLVAYDEHPLSYVFAAEDGRLRVANPYFGPGGSEDDSEGADDEEDEADNGPTWTLGDIVTALGANGLATISLLELRESDRFESALDRLDEVDFDEVSRVPGAFLLVAVKL